jgi:16S rRNA (uracil1498-N3)-methyltransferase
VGAADDLESTGPKIGFAADSSAVAHTFVDQLADRVEVGGVDGHHLGRVRRLEVGEIVTAADGTGRWRPYAVDAVDRGTVALRATDDARQEPQLVPRLCVAFALTKGQKPETVVRQLTELGVDAVIPVVAERSVVRMRGDRADELAARLARVAREAACQSRRARVTVVETPCPLVDVVSSVGARLIVAERAGPGHAAPGPPLDAGAPPGGWTLLVGPEGGFSPAEQARLAGVPRLAVGAHVLRAETAAVAVASLLTARRHRATPGGEGLGASRD